MKKLIPFLITLSIFTLSCNKIDTTKEVFNLISPVEVTPCDHAYTQTVVRKIYIEEFTGHRCIFCPVAARELQAIIDEDPAIIATAIHCGELAIPGSPPYFNNNYKTPMGECLYEDFNIKGLPKAIINRMEISPNKWEIGKDEWRNVIKTIDRNDIRAGIELQCTVNNAKKEVEAYVAVSIIKELPNPVQLCLILQQDSIVSGQVDGDQYILDYTHNHVFRSGFNGTYGTKLTPNGMVEVQSKYATTFKISCQNFFPYGQIPVEINHCSVVAYLIDTKTKEIIQVESVHLH
jgi:hypothetical protein